MEEPQQPQLYFMSLETQPMESEIWECDTFNLLTWPASNHSHAVTAKGSWWGACQLQISPVWVSEGTQTPFYILLISSDMLSRVRKSWGSEHNLPTALGRDRNWVMTVKSKHQKRTHHSPWALKWPAEDKLGSLEARRSFLVYAGDATAAATANQE